MMWRKSDSNDKKLMADVITRRISVGRLICVISISCIMLTSCGVQDKALVLIGEEALTGQVSVDGGPTGDADSTLQEENAVGLTDMENAATAAASREQTIVVFVCGAVQNPGVVELPLGSRAADALEAAGGLLAEAQSDYVNLAVKLEDAQKLYFPTVEEAALLIQEEKTAASGLVNINTADKEQLCTLPGIGEARAEDIIAYRERNGDFRSKEDIMKVSGIKQNAYAKLQDCIMVE